MTKLGWFFILAIVILLAVTLWLSAEEARIKDEADRLRQELRQLEAENELLRQGIDHLERKREDVLQRLEEWLDEWQVELWEATAYAPLDPAAVDGWDYCCDPDITASGAQVEIGRTIAAGPSVPFGTLVWIEGHGLYEVQDRGGAIGPGQLDIAVQTRAEALRFGRQQVKVIYQGEGM